MAAVIRWMERIGALALFLIVALIAITTVTRYFFNWPIPDSDSVSSMLLAIVVFWGLASACLYGEHIQLDLFVEKLSRQNKTVVLKVGLAIMFVAIGTTTWVSAGRILDLRKTGEKTYDLGLPLWPFYLVALVGLFMASVVLAGLLFGLVRQAKSETDEHALSGGRE